MIIKKELKKKKSTQAWKKYAHKLQHWYTTQMSQSNTELCLSDFTLQRSTAVKVRSGSGGYR